MSSKVDQLSDYEMGIRANIKRNTEYMLGLGLSPSTEHMEMYGLGPSDDKQAARQKTPKPVRSWRKPIVAALTAVLQRRASWNREYDSHPATHRQDRVPGNQIRPAASRGAVEEVQGNKSDRDDGPDRQGRYGIPHKNPVRAGGHEGMAHRGEGGSLQGTPELGVCVFILCSVLTLALAFPLPLPLVHPPRVCSTMPSTWAIWSPAGLLSAVRGKASMSTG